MFQILMILFMKETYIMVDLTLFDSFDCNMMLAFEKIVMRVVL